MAVLVDNNTRVICQGFTGSAGKAIVLAHKAAMSADGRYTEQVKAQVDPELFQYADLAEGGPPVWLKANAGKGAIQSPVIDSDEARRAQEAADRSADLPASEIDIDAMKITQHWDRYTEENHEVWRILFTKRMEQLSEYGSNVFLDGSKVIQLDPAGVPLPEALLIALISMARSKCAARDLSWLTNTTALSARRHSANSKSMNSRLRSVSSADVGSSAITSSG